MSLILLHYIFCACCLRLWSNLSEMTVLCCNLQFHGAYCIFGGSVAEWLACAGAIRPGFKLQLLSGNSLRQAVYTHRASVHQAAKLVAALLRVARVTAGLAEGNGSLPPGL